MKGVSISGRSVALGGIFAAVACVGMLAPAHASAQAASVRTQQLLPPGQNTCQVMMISDIEPHVYGGELESFDVTLSSDVSHSYVGVLAQVGNTPIPLNFITRWAGSPSGTRIHVDTPNIAVGGGTSVNLTLLASLPGQPTCVTSISFDATGSGAVAPYVPPSTSTPTQGSPSTASPVSTSPASGGVAKGGASGAQAASSSVGTSNSAGAIAATASGANLFSNMCVAGNAFRLWFMLLAIYVIVVAIVVFAEPSFLEDSVLGSTAMILIPLFLLLLFWYLSETCRAASWIPVIACVIAIAGLFLAFREYETPPLLSAPSDR
jgi:hypothetical protein